MRSRGPELPARSRVPEQQRLHRFRSATEDQERDASEIRERKRAGRNHTRRRLARRLDDAQSANRRDQARRQEHDPETRTGQRRQVRAGQLRRRTRRWTALRSDTRRTRPGAGRHTKRETGGAGSTRTAKFRSAWQGSWTRMRPTTSIPPATYPVHGLTSQRSSPRVCIRFMKRLPGRVGAAGPRGHQHVAGGGAGGGSRAADAGRRRPAGCRPRRPRRCASATWWGAPPPTRTRAGMRCAEQGRRVRAAWPAHAEQSGFLVGVGGVVAAGACQPGRGDGQQHVEQELGGRGSDADAAQERRQRRS